MDALTTIQARPLNGKTFWRSQFNTLMQEFRCAQRMHSLQSIHRCELKWTVVYYGRRHIEGKLAVSIERLGGLAGEW